MNSKNAELENACRGESPTKSQAGESILRYQCFMDSFHNIIELCNTIVYIVACRLKDRVDGTWKEQDDMIFEPHTLLIASIRLLPPEQQIKFVPLAARLWVDDLRYITLEKEEELKRSDPNARIHKGAPLFNVGICFFISGDFDRAFQYFAEAGKEDELSGRGSRNLILTGVNDLADRVIVIPLLSLIKQWDPDYSRITTNSLSKDEFKSVLGWVGQRPTDAYQTITSLHKLRLLPGTENNEVSRFQGVRALADLVIAVESSMRRWQKDKQGELYVRLRSLFAPYTICLKTFDRFHEDFYAEFPKPRHETAEAVDWVVAEALEGLTNSADMQVRVGIACYLVLRLRNSLMHVNEEGLNLQKDSVLCTKISGIVFACLRISMHGEQNTLSTILNPPN